MHIHFQIVKLYKRLYAFISKIIDAFFMAKANGFYQILQNFSIFRQNYFKVLNFFKKRRRITLI